MLSGKLPFQKGDLGYHHVHTTPPDIREIEPDVPEAVAKLILFCMEKPVEKRPQSVAEVAAALKAVPEYARLA